MGTDIWCRPIAKLFSSLITEFVFHGLKLDPMNGKLHPSSYVRQSVLAVTAEQYRSSVVTGTRFDVVVYNENAS